MNAPPQNAPVTGTLLRIGTPIALSGLSFALMSAVDTAFVSSLGVHALAGVGLAGTLAFTVLMPTIGLLRAVKIGIASARGAGEDDAGFVGAALRLAALAAVPSTIGVVALVWLAPQLLASPEAGVAASEYVAIRTLITPAFVLAICLREIFYGRGDTRTPLRAIVVANLFNGVANYVGVFVLHAGVAGVAWATVLSGLVQLSVLLLAARGQLRGWHEATPAHRRVILDIGLPYAAQRMAESLAFSVISAMVARVGDVAAAAHQLAIQLLLLGNLPSMALGDATSILTARSVGAGDDRSGLRTLAAAALRVGLSWAVPVCVLAWLAIPLVAPWLAPGGEREVVLAIRACGFLLIFEAASHVAQGLLRASGDPRYPSVVVTLNSSLLSPLLCFLAIRGLGWGVMAAWSAFVVEVLLTTTLLWLRFRAHVPAPAPVPAMS